MNEINWTTFKADVAKTMLPIMYRQETANSALVSIHSKVAVEAAVEIAEMIVERLQEK